MAPKKKAAKGKDPAKLVDKENLKRAETEIVSLQRQLELRSNEALDARRHEREWREKCSAYEELVAAHQEDTLDITSDMMRKYKALQDQTQSYIKDLEQQIGALKGKLDAEVERANKAELERDQIQEESTKELTVLRNKIDNMQIEFADMLKLTIDKMHQKLELAYSQGVDG